jgi:hypothetical protein
MNPLFNPPSSTKNAGKPLLNILKMIYLKFESINLAILLSDIAISAIAIDK